jgi:lysophospholipase L1-like esterase
MKHVVEKTGVKLGLCGIGVLVLLTSCTFGQDAGWIGSWGASPLPPRESQGPIGAAPSFRNQTIRHIVRLSAGGERVRLRLSNEFGATPLVIGAASIARLDTAGGLRADTIEPVRFSGQASATIPPGAPLLSDPVDFPVAELESVAVALFFPEDTGPCTCHASGMQTALVSESGDFTRADFAPSEMIQSRAFLSGVEVETRARARTIVVLGDSISDGIGSTVDANRRWPDLLADRLAASSDDVDFGVVNAGISGNRVLADGAGVSALARFDRDVLAVPGASHVIVFEGVNDLGIAFGQFTGPLAQVFAALPRTVVTFETMVGAYRQLIARAHSQGLKIYGATIAPYEGSGYYSSEGDALRQSINDWIRDSGEFDAVLDFDAVLRDSEKPSRIADGLHAGDFLHGSDEGYRRMADSIDLRLFD